MVSFVLVGCSVEPGGSDDPADFKTSLTPLGETPQAAPESMTEVATPQAGRLDAIEQQLAQTSDRLDRLELSFSTTQQSLVAIQETAAQALEKAEKGPLAGIDLSNDAKIGDALMQQSLEQIIGISRLLLDKMEQQAAEPKPVPAPEPQVQ
ncbi:MAG: hypothetical protein KKB70_11270 [Proteobacteria bacterium]|nr:hypothetical protein [Pseudomonadota bacterium]MBU1611784.1 hypothetical protein [Pseudomonadota bacterium]